MSRFTDDDLRTAFRLRAMGRPRPGLYQRIRQSARSAHDTRGVPAIHGVTHRGLVLARLTAITAVAAVLVLAPVVSGGFEARLLDLISEGRPPDQTAAGMTVPANADVENDGGDDDVGDDDVGDDDVGDDDVGDDEDGIDEDDQADDDDIGDDGLDPEESEDDN